MPFLSHGSHRIRYEIDGPADAPVYVLVNGLTQYAELWAAYREALVARQFRVATFDLLGQGASDKPRLFITQDDQVAALRLLIDELGDGPGLSQRHQLRRPDRAPLCDLAWRPAGRPGADELLCRAFAATAAARQCLAHRADPRRHQLSAGHAAADEPVRSVAEAVAGQARQREATGLAGQRRLRPAEPDGILPRLRAADAAAGIDRRADHDPERRIRLPDAARAARNPARPHSRQLARDHSKRPITPSPWRSRR